MFNAFPQQQWLHERTSMLRYTCITYLVSTINESPLGFGKKLKQSH